MRKYYNFFKIFYKNFTSSDTSLLASNLTYMMILSLFPFLAIIIGISKGFGFDEIILDLLKKIFINNVDIFEYFINITNNILANSKGDILTGFGILILISYVINTLILLEDTFNKIWHVKKERSYLSRLINYVSFIFIAPLFFVLITASSTFILKIMYNLFYNIPTFVIIFIKVINILLSILFITLLFILIPNTRVKILPAITGSLITNIGIYILAVIYTNLQVSINNYNIIYGTLAFIPIFLIWIKYLWIIVLIGAQITYSLQTYKELVEDKYEVSIYLQKKLSIYLLSILIDNFLNSTSRLSLNDLNKITNLNKNIIKYILYNLVELELINVVNDDIENMIYYQVNINPDIITISYLNDLIEKKDVEKEKLIINLNNDEKEKFDRLSREIILDNNKLIRELR